MKNDHFPRSPYDEVHGLVYFGRLLDKIRLHAVGKLPEAYIENLGHDQKFDGTCLRFLGVSFEDLEKLVIAGATDDEAWEWCVKNGRPHTEEEIMIWNRYMTKCGWRDSMTETLKSRLRQIGKEDRSDIQTLFEYLDLDEGRKK